MCIFIKIYVTIVYKYVSVVVYILHNQSTKFVLRAKTIVYLSFELHLKEHYNEEII